MPFTTHHRRRTARIGVLFSCVCVLCLPDTPAAHAACDNPPQIDAAATTRTADSIAIRYHDACSGERETRVSVRAGVRDSFSTVKIDPPNSGGFRIAHARNLRSDTRYTFKVEVRGADDVVRHATRSFETLRDTSCVNPPRIDAVPEDRTESSVTIRYHDACTNERETRVSFRSGAIGPFRTAKVDPPNSGGFRLAEARNLLPNRTYTFRVEVRSPDNVLRRTERRFSTLRPRPSTAVVLGDSFASGEGGRWRGNADGSGLGRFPAGGNRGTDGTRGRGTSTVYEPASVTNACHRALTAPIHSLKGEFDRTVNLACSGAKNRHLMPLADAGEGFRGEAPQIDQLERLLATHDVGLVVLGVGGNDMGFSNLITGCIKAWAKDLATGLEQNCSGSVDERVKALDGVRRKTRSTLGALRRMMERHGKREGDDYRIVLMGYPSIVQSDSSLHRSRGDFDRLAEQCPFRGGDLARIESRLMPVLNGAFAALAERERIDFINVKDAFEGHQLCDRRPIRGQQTSDDSQMTLEASEWVRFVDAYVDHPLKITGLLDAFAIVRTADQAADALRGHSDASRSQGRLQESMHPNQFGQQAIGRCLKAVWRRRVEASGPRSYDCFTPVGRERSGLDDIVVQVRQRDRTASLPEEVTVPPGSSITVPIDVKLGIDDGIHALKTASFELAGRHEDVHAVKATLVHPVSGERLRILDNPAPNEPGVDEPTFPFGFSAGVHFLRTPFVDGRYLLELSNRHENGPLTVKRFDLTIH